MRDRMSSVSDSTYLFAAAIALGVLIAAATALAGPLAADKAPEPALTATGAEGTYLQQMHQRVHSRWAENFLRLAAEKLPASDPVNQPTRAATADVVLGDDGQILTLELSKSSGYGGFDDAVKEILHDSVPFPAAPVDVRSDDDRVHLRWTFARDERRCSGVTVLRAEDPMPVAFPKLLRAHRDQEVLRRLRVARDAGAPIEPMMTTTANAWLQAAIARPSATVEVADQLATMGDTAGVAWLKGAVKRPELAQAAGRALTVHHQAVCPLVKAAFSTPEGNGKNDSKTSNEAEQHTAAVALATAGEAECAPGLIALLQNHKARVESRIAAAIALGPIVTDEARKALAEAAKDDAVPVRAAALLAGARPGSGRGKVLSLVTPLRDPLPEMRAAAAAGIVRAGGDTNLADLYVVFKDSNPRPATAVALELDNLRTEEATKLLVRLLKRPHLSVQLAAARALIKRGARESFPALRPFLDAKVDPELRGLALVSADASTLDNLARTVAASDAKDPKTLRLALATYRARVARGERAPAGALFIAIAPRLPPADQANALVDWLAAAGAPRAAIPAGAPRAAREAPASGGGTTTAAATPSP